MAFECGKSTPELEKKAFKNPGFLNLRLKSPNLGFFYFWVQFYTDHKKP